MIQAQMKMVGMPRGVRPGSHLLTSGPHGLLSLRPGATEASALGVSPLDAHASPTVTCRKTFAAQSDPAAADQRIARTLADPRKEQKSPTTVSRKEKNPHRFGL